MRKLHRIKKIGNEWSFSYVYLIERNRGIIRNQSCLKDAVISIAGCGRAGGETAVTLARMGVGKLKLAEPDSFEVANLNSQFGSKVKTIGINKAEVVRAEINEINPFCEVEVYTDGINKKNVKEFLKDANIALEEIDYRSPYYTAIFHKSARALHLPVMTALPVAWSSFFFFFDPDGLTFEEYVGMNNDCMSEEFENYSYPLTAYCPEPPLYVGKELIKKVVNEEIEIPAIAPAINLTSGILSSFVYFYLSGEKEIKPVPYYYSTGDMFRLSPRRISFFRKIIYKFFANSSN